MTNITRRYLAGSLAALLGAGLLMTADVPLFAQINNYYELPEGYYEVVVSRNVMVPMRDGVRMATDVYLPARDGVAVPGQFPTLLSRTPYGKNGSDQTARGLASNGYAVAIQDTRGRYESEGTFYIYVHEGRDGYDAVEWAAAQPWSNGDVGTFGGSYLAATQMAMAVEAPPNLKAMFIRVGTSNYWEDGSGSGGAFALLHNLGYALNLVTTSQEAQADPARQRALVSAREPDNFREWIRAYPFYPNTSLFELIPTYHRWFQDWVDHADFDDYWKQNGYTFELSYDQIPDIPIYYIGGWYDIFLRGTLNNYAGLAAKNSSPVKLMMGPWEHGVGSVRTGDVAFGAQAEVDLTAERLLWFDQAMKTDDERPDTGLFDGPSAQMFIMGGDDNSRTEGGINHGGGWVSVTDWPPPQADNREFYLHADGRLAPEPPAAGAEPTTYTFDPANPVPTIGGKVNSGGQLVTPAPFDQRCIAGEIFGCEDNLPLSARRDVLVFQTPPLDEDIVVMGPIEVKLWIASSAKDTDFTAKLIDSHPPSDDYPWGYDMLLADRIVRARYRNGLEVAELMEPGQVYEVTIDLLGTANRFKAGHRIRLDISSSNFPFFDVNPNTGERPGHHTHTVKARNSIYHDDAHPSHVVLPIVSADIMTSSDVHATVNEVEVP